jgi:hypothetical protein
VSRPSLILVFALVMAACAGGSNNDGDPVVTPVAGSPSEAVELLVEFLAAPDFDAAADLAVPGHAALAALAEGASFAEVAEALRSGDRAVAANFWAGFAQGSSNFLTGEIEVSDGARVVQSGVEFSVAEVLSAVGERRVYTSEGDGHRIDLFASFGGGLAPTMIPAVELLLSVRGEDSVLILAELNRIVPSLTVASRQEWLPGPVALDVVRLIELITRVR